MVFFDDLEVGSTRTTGEIQITECEVIDFGRKWDPLPFHTDPEAARRSPFGGLTAAGCHVFCVASRLTYQLKPLAVIAGLKQELEFPHPARPGDRLSLASECIEKRASKSKPDRGIVTFRSAITNQDGVLVLRMTSTLMVRRRANA